jgi:1-acyl-sn-glycerol-3-phosphate acyltransferase
MSDLYYDVVHAVGSAIFWASSKALVLHRDRVKRMRPPYILAANHHSPFDVPLLIRHTPHRLDFLSTVEAFGHPFSNWFYGSMNAFPIDRSKLDHASVRGA